MALIAACCVLASMPGCRGGGRAAPPDPARSRQLRVAAAANLEFTFDEIAAEFQATFPDVEVTVSYGSSGSHFAQLANRAPYDVFLSADVDYPRRLVEQGLAVDEDCFVYAVGRLAVWVPNESPLDLGKLGIWAVAAEGVRKVAMANPRHAPYGRAAEAAMKTLGVYEEARERLLVAENVEQAAHFVHTGAAQVGILPLSLVLAPAMRSAGRHWGVPRDAHPPLEQAGVVLAGAGDPAAAQSLVDFLTGPGGREILARHGYELPKE